MRLHGLTRFVINHRGDTLDTSTAGETSWGRVSGCSLVNNDSCVTRADVEGEVDMKPMISTDLFLNTSEVRCGGQDRWKSGIYRGFDVHSSLIDPW
jgi:hypothetical protein